MALNWTDTAAVVSIPNKADGIHTAAGSLVPADGVWVVQENFKLHARTHTHTHTYI